MNYYNMSPGTMEAFLAAVQSDGYTILAESADGRGWETLAAPTGDAIRTDRRPTALSFKEHIFPKTEPIFFYKKTSEGVELLDPPAEYPKTVIFGARPCDAAATDILSKVFNWDYRDAFFNGRADASIRIGASCRYRDDQCFCTSVGLSPASTRGSDLFLHDAPDGDRLLEVVTEKGQHFLGNHLRLFDEPIGAQPVPIEGPEPRFDAAGVRAWIQGHFEDPFWSKLGEVCLGCAQCAFAYPVCHCFDIVDEDDTIDGGRRMKNWDACQPGLFTRHASGHNPRDTQAKRYRQRISHKFSYYPEKFGEVLCTGCGRCTRGCPIGMDIGAIAHRISELQAHQV